MTAPADLSAPDLTQKMDQLAAQLPTGWALNASLAEAAPEDGPASFTAAIDAGGQASINGVVPDDTMRQTVQSLARAQLGPVEGELRLDPALRDEVAPGICWHDREDQALDSIRKLKAIAAREKADLWPNHDQAFWRTLRQFPEFHA